MNTITPISVKSKVYSTNNLENHSYLETKNLSLQEDKFTPSFKGYDKGAKTSLTVIIQAIIAFLAKLFSVKHNAEQNPQINENPDTPVNENPVNKEEIVINPDTPVNEPPVEKKVIVEDADFQAAMRINPDLTKKLSGIDEDEDYPENINNYMVRKIVEMHQENENDAKCLTYLLDYDNADDYTNEDVDYLAEQVRKYHAEVLDYAQRNPQETIKVLKIREEDPEFAKEYNKVMLDGSFWTDDALETNMAKIDDIHQMKKEKPEVYSLLMKSAVDYDADEMLFLQDIITEKIDRSITKVNDLVIENSHDNQETTEEEKEEEGEEEYEDNDNDGIRDIIHIGILHSKHPEEVEKIMRIFEVDDIDIIRPLIESTETNGPEFLDYILYKEDLTLEDLENDMDKAIADAKEYAETVEKYKPIFDTITPTKYTREYRFNTINEIINSSEKEEGDDNEADSYDYMSGLEEYGEQMIACDILPDDKEELKNIIEFFENLPSGTEMTPNNIKSMYYNDYPNIFK